MNLQQHPFFTPWTDPVSGVVSYVLTERLAPMQQSFYFTNPSISADEKWLWFYTAYSPSPVKTLGVVSLDPARPVKMHFPWATFSSVSPLVAPEGDSIYFCMEDSVYRQGITGGPGIICTLPKEYKAGRRLERLATHLTLSADGRSLLLDGELGNIYFTAIADIATGDVRIIREFSYRHNHGQFSPVDNELYLIPADTQTDPVTGIYSHHDFRIFLADIYDKRFECLTPHIRSTPYHGACHEWWSADGKVCYVDYDTGAYEYDLATRTHTHIWREPLCHAHCDSSRRYWCADQSPYYWAEKPCQVLFYDSKSGHRIEIASGLPEPSEPRGKYHIDPHPQFSPLDTAIVYTTTVLGKIDVAITPLAGILA
ncbi:MAG: hypothetical protein WCJ56_09610 [bacterium]